MIKLVRHLGKKKVHENYKKLENKGLLLLAFRICGAMCDAVLVSRLPLLSSSVMVYPPIRIMNHRGNYWWKSRDKQQEHNILIPWKIMSRSVWSISETRSHSKLKIYSESLQECS